MVANIYNINVFEGQGKLYICLSENFLWTWMLKSGKIRNVIIRTECTHDVPAIMHMSKISVQMWKGVLNVCWNEFSEELGWIGSCEKGERSEIHVKGINFVWTVYFSMFCPIAPVRPWDPLKGMFCVCIAPTTRTKMGNQYFQKFSYHILHISLAKIQYLCLAVQ